MKSFLGVMATASTFSVVSATAQSLPENMYLDGYIEVTSHHDIGLIKNLGRGSLNFGLSPTRDNGIGVGFSLGIDANRADGFSGVDATTLYPAVTFALGDNGLLSVGVPRPVLNYGYLATDTMAHASRMEFLLEYLSIVPSLAANSHQYTQVTHDFYGLRYDDVFGNTKVGASYHSLNFARGHYNIYSIAFQHQLGGFSNLQQTKVFGGFEKVSGKRSTVNTYSLGIETSSEKTRVGVMIYRVDSRFRNFTTANLYADYNVSDNFSVSASIFHVDDTGQSKSDIFSVGAEYTFLNGGYLNTTYTDENFQSSGQGEFEISLGWRFQ